MNYYEAIEAVTTPPANHFDKIVEWSVRWAKNNSGQNFTSETLRIFFEIANDNLRPAEPRVYGAVIKAMQKQGLIERIGYVSAANKQAHHRPISLWRVR